jgi:hypothetical protein
VDPTAAFWFGLSDAELAEVYPWEDWILAKSRVGPIPSSERGDPLEDDLFAGIPVTMPAVTMPAVTGPDPTGSDATGPDARTASMSDAAS